MNRRIGGIILAAILGMGVLLGASSGAPAAEKVRYLGFYDGGELFTVRALFRQLHGIDPEIRVPTGLGDIDMDGVPEVFLTDQRGGYCGTAGCSTSIYKNVEGEWIGVGALQSIFGESGDPLIFIR